MYIHTLSCEYPEGCSCGASSWNALIERNTKAERPKINLELSELYTVAAAYDYKTPLAMIDDLLKQKKETEDNILYILKDDPDVIRAHEGGGPEDLNMSLALTMLKTRNNRDKKKV